MKTVVTRNSKLIAARVTQPKPTAKWEGLSEDGFWTIGDTAEECRDNLCTRGEIAASQAR